MTMRCPICQGDDFSQDDPHFFKCMLCSTKIRRPMTGKFELLDYHHKYNIYEFPNWNNLLFRTKVIQMQNEKYLFNASTIISLALREMKDTKFKNIYRLLNLPDYCFPSKIFTEFVPIMLNKKIPLTLGIISKKGANEEIIKICRELKELISHIIIVIDAEFSDDDLRRTLLDLTSANVQVLGHPLNGDFAMQRNRIQVAAATPWVLHLDTDETLSEEAKRRLPYILHQAEAYGRVAVSMARQNIVDGVVSAHFPDTQVRLLQRTIRFTRRVHEYPEVSSRRTLLALNADILHFMDSSRLGKREILYENMLPGAGRPSDTERLRQALPPDVPVVR